MLSLSIVCVLFFFSSSKWYQDAQWMGLFIAIVHCVNVFCRKKILNLQACPNAVTTTSTIENDENKIKWREKKTTTNRQNDSKCMMPYAKEEVSKESCKSPTHHQTITLIIVFL